MTEDQLIKSQRIIKPCTTCLIEKPLTEFHKAKRESDGYCDTCKDCKKIYRKNYYLNHKEKELSRNDRYRENNIEKTMIFHAKLRAKESNYPFDITEEDIKIPSTCPVFDIPLFRGKGYMCDNSPSLDKIIPEKGYVKDNIIIISWKANRLKNNALIGDLEKIVNFYKSYVN
jgi:hypothetical protein